MVQREDGEASIFILSLAGDVDESTEQSANIQRIVTDVNSLQVINNKEFIITRLRAHIITRRILHLQCRDVGAEPTGSIAGVDEWEVASKQKV